MINYGELPKIECYPGQLNQVFMNILINAIDALEDAAMQHSIPTITVSTKMLNTGWAVIRYYYTYKATNCTSFMKNLFYVINHKGH